MYCIILLIIILILFLILFKFQIREGFRTDLDQDMATNMNCLDYITKELNWDLSHNIDKYIPKSIIDPNLINIEKQKIIDNRKDILKLFDNVKTKTYSGINQKYSSTGACVLRDNKMEKNLTPNDKCTFNGKYLSSELNPVDKQYGRQEVISTNVQAKLFDDYVKSKDVKSQYYPNDGCVFETTNKDAFFDAITQLSKIKTFDTDNELNLAIADKNKYQEKIGKLNSTLSLYGIPTDLDPDTNIFTDCTTKRTNEVNSDDYTYDVLSNLKIKCGDEEVLSGFNLNHDNNKTYYKYTCCKPHTSDNYVRPKLFESKETNENKDITHKMECEQYLNGFGLEIDEDINNYNYTCSTMYKKSEKDARNVNFSCKDEETDLIDANSGILNMQKLNVNCKEGMLKNVELIKNDNKFGYKYTCCRPYIT